jgi:hypothetical protein
MREAIQHGRLHLGLPKTPAHALPFNVVVFATLQHS